MAMTATVNVAYYSQSAALKGLLSQRSELIRMLIP